MEKNLKKNLDHYAVHLKVTQYYKSTTLQKITVFVYHLLSITLYNLWGISHLIPWTSYEIHPVIIVSSFLFDREGNWGLKKSRTLLKEVEDLGFEPRDSQFMGFLGIADGKDSVCNAGELGLIPGLGRSPGEGNGYPHQYSCLENAMDTRVPKSRT